MEVGREESEIGYVVKDVVDHSTTIITIITMGITWELRLRVALAASNRQVQ